MSSPQVASPSTSPLPEWQAHHKIKKHHYNPLRDPCLARKVGFVFFAILLIPFTPLLGIVKLGLYLRERYIIKYQPTDPLKGIREMKEKEEMDKFQTMQNVWTEFNIHSSSTTTLQAWTTELSDKLQKFDIHKKALHYLLKELNKKAPLDERTLQILIEFKRSAAFKSRDPEILGVLTIEKLKKLSEDYYLPGLNDEVWATVERKVNAQLINQNQRQAELKKFQIKLEGLVKIVERNSQSKGFDATTANREFITALRDLLETPIYRQFKEDLNIKAIHFLQRLAVDIWNKAPSMDAYMKVGENIAQKTHTTPNAGEELKGAVVAEKLRTSHEEMKKHHYPAKGLVKMFTYAISHIEQTIGGLASEGIVPGMQYDGHGTLSNNPSLQGSTDIEYRGETIKVNNCYGGSPTIGNHKTYPEFEAVLQAAENNQFLKDEERYADIPCLMNYHNFQNLDHHHGEGDRSQLIMLLRSKYPLSFRGMTLAKDSKLYLMHQDSDVEWQDAQTFRTIMLDQMNRSFDRNEKGHGFYFPGAKKDWQPVFNAILDAATAHFQTVEQRLRGQNIDIQQNIQLRRDLQGAYQEFVYAMIKAHSEVESIKLLEERDVKKNILIVLINACKENIDRGGMANTLYLYLRIMLHKEFSTQQKMALLQGAMHCRAISARDRLILSSRMPQGLAFMKYTEAGEFDTSLTDFYTKKLKYPVTNISYSPHLARKPMTMIA